MVRFVDASCPKCNRDNPDPNCPECYGYGLVGIYDAEHIDPPREETPWSRALADALIENEMTLRQVAKITGFHVSRISDLKNGAQPPTADEKAVLEGLLKFLTE